MGGTLGVIGGSLVGGSGALPSMMQLLETVAAAAVADATPHTKGAWVELIASTVGDSNLLVITAPNSQNGIANGALLDIGVGAAGSEVAVAENVGIGQHSNYVFPIPVSIPAGSRVSARVQSIVVSKSITVQMGTYFQPGLTTPTAVAALGTDPATSNATAMSNGNWVEIVASAAVAYRYLVLIPATNQSSTTASGSLELGIGAAGAEVAKPGVILYSGSTNEVIALRGSTSSMMATIFDGCAAGARIAARVTGGPNQASLIGVPY